MSIQIRKPFHTDEEDFIQLSMELSMFNRGHHPQKDDFFKVLEARRERVKDTFAIEDANHLLLLATLHEETVGYAIASVQYPSPAASDGTELFGYLDEIFVRDSARGYGVGKRLLDEVTAWIQEKGAKKMRLQMFEWNINAEEFYKSAGFHVYSKSLERELD